MQDNPETICLLGGYGDVGLRLARLLHDRTPLTIVLAGRDGDRAEAAARKVGERCRGLALDVRANGAPARLAGVDLCVNLTEATPPRLAADLVARGTHFIDSAATPAYVAQLRQAIEAVQSPRAAGVLECGLAPGLTNLLARRMWQNNRDIRSIDIMIELGMGAHHGIAATIWSLQALAQTYPMKSGGRWQDTRTGSVSRRFDTGTGRVRAIGFAFSDQASIARELRLDGARTFLAVDPRWMTRAMGWMARWPLGAFVSRLSGPLARAMRHLPGMGGSGTRLVLEGFNARGEVIASHKLTGGAQADMTATVIAQTVQELVRLTANEPGLQPLYRLLDPASVAQRPFRVSGFDL